MLLQQPKRRKDPFMPGRDRDLFAREHADRGAYRQRHSEKREDAA